MSNVELVPADLTYLYLDRRHYPMHWAMVLELAPTGPRLTLEQLRARVAERSTLFELFRFRIRRGRVRMPRATAAATIEVSRHVTEVTFDGDVTVRLGERMATRLSTSTPRWHVTLLTPRAGGAQFLLVRVHHALSDGIAGAAFAALLADGTTDDLREFERFATSPRFRTGPIDPGARAGAEAAFGEQWLAGSEGRGWPRLTDGGRREVGLAHVATRELRKAARRHDATVHEYVLATIGRTLAAAPPAGSAAKVVRVTLPVTNDPDFRHTGNAVSIALINLPGGETGLDAQLERSRTELALVETRRPHLAVAAPDTPPNAPWLVQRVVAGRAMRRLDPDIHVGINPGFATVRSVLGTEIVGLTALSPLVGYSFSVTCLVLGRHTSFGVVADPDAVGVGYAGNFAEKFTRAL
ncbi:wax ester/triacylglycerol synthase domain-containing protein [Skermania piniformis]|uniref:Wax ester/triacylglycerol synthase family O-acyltransferase n=1 Tax=Skermania pinensis TaxID=39122 RepID=A0ABX8S9T9_9ACTN|nr:wax ester/triacylglycerol synthase domain-containing protein [Skermania piniformis]QXQ13325.1 wax ester/triacylglycerol synthase family O-acyltransferase [Skermania piniformis]